LEQIHFGNLAHAQLLGGGFHPSMELGERALGDSHPVAFDVRQKESVRKWMNTKMRAP
jgi:hypothetical protein